MVGIEIQALWCCIIFQGKLKKKIKIASKIDLRCDIAFSSIWYRF